MERILYYLTNYALTIAIIYTYFHIALMVKSALEVRHSICTKYGVPQETMIYRKPRWWQGLIWPFVLLDFFALTLTRWFVDVVIPTYYDRVIAVHNPEVYIVDENDEHTQQTQGGEMQTGKIPGSQQVKDIKIKGFFNNDNNNDNNNDSSTNDSNNDSNNVTGKDTNKKANKKANKKSNKSNNRSNNKSSNKDEAEESKAKI